MLINTCLSKEISFSEWNTLKENQYGALETYNVYYFSCFVYIFLADKTFNICISFGFSTLIALFEYSFAGYIDTPEGGGACVRNRD